MKLVIAEKPSVARSIALVLGASQKKEGYWEGNGWQVSWCLGHLTAFCKPEHYDPKYAVWCREDLPILPNPWKMDILPDAKARFSILKHLMNASDVTEVVNACDAGREGELIFRTVYRLAGCRKPMKRLWISSMEDSAIRQGFQELHPGAEYDSLYAAALCRARADWLVGINATRLFSVLYHQTLNIGRVMSPTLSLVVQREHEIAAFEPKPFYHVTMELPGFSVSSDRVDAESDAVQMLSDCADSDCTVTSVETQEKRQNPPLLYDLTTLQRDANRLLGFTAQQTLDYLQDLYEQQLCTYPRTDSQYLTSDMEEDLPDLAELVGHIYGTEVLSCTSKPLIQNSKITDHHAILPTPNIETADLDSLPLGQRAILKLISIRLLCAVGEPKVWSETLVTVRCAGHLFTAKGQRILMPGWSSIAPQKESSEKCLPDLQDGQILHVSNCCIRKGCTTPPDHFTEDTLLHAMETAGAQEMPDTAERKGLGTPATRAGILEKLISIGFLNRRKQKKTVYLLPSDTAFSLMTVLPEPLQSPLLTADWEYRLGQIQCGEQSPEAFMTEITELLREILDQFEVLPGTEDLFADPEKIVGKCPRCGSDVSEMYKGFFCVNPSCKFSIWKNNKWWALKKKSPTRQIVTELLKTGRTSVCGLYSERAKKNYNADVIMEDDGTYVNFNLEFKNMCK